MQLNSVPECSKGVQSHQVLTNITEWLGQQDRSGMEQFWNFWFLKLYLMLPQMPKDLVKMAVSEIQWLIKRNTFYRIRSQINTLESI